MARILHTLVHVVVEETTNALLLHHIVVADDLPRHLDESQRTASFHHIHGKRYVQHRSHRLLLVDESCEQR